MKALEDKLYYSIGEVSEMLGLSLPTLRYWESQVTQLKPKTNEGRSRFYTREDIELLQRLMYLREQNVPVKDWSRRLRAEGTQDKQQAIYEALKQVREELVELRNLI
ncbi:MAG: MerR family transcriptional regulator [Paludibacteraceae bacterium]|nr:MerR family transcriptional regulator [Paludibacteraceae bacterium]